METETIELEVRPELAERTPHGSQIVPLQAVQAQALVSKGGVATLSALQSQFLVVDIDMLGDIVELVIGVAAVQAGVDLLLGFRRV